MLRKVRVRLAGQGGTKIKNEASRDITQLAKWVMGVVYLGHQMSRMGQRLVNTEERSAT